MSRPAEAPAEVTIRPSSTNSTSGFTLTVGYRLASSPAASQWVVARLPSSSPAAARMNVPEQIDATRAPFA